MRRRYLTILLLVLNFPHLAACAQVGDSRATLLEEKGMPVSIVAGGGRAILTFQDRTIVTLVDDRVVQVSRALDATQRQHRRLAVPAIPDDRHRLIVAVCVGFAAALLLFRAFFSGFSDFVDCLRFYFQPDWISAFRDEWVEDKWSTMKLFVWVCLSACAGMSFYGYTGGSGGYLIRLFSHSP